MAGTVYEFFGYRASDRSDVAVGSAHSLSCPFIGERCEKTLSDGTVSGVCSVKPVTSAPVICCPIRMYAGEYRVLQDVARIAFGEGHVLEPGATAMSRAVRESRSVVAVFGKRWGRELRLPQKDGTQSFFVDWVLALIDASGKLEEFVAVEVQTIDTTGNYRASRSALLEDERDIVPSSVGLNWENVNKRILPQLIYKGQVLQRESLCKKGLFFICPTPVYDRILRRLGGQAGLVKYALQPAAVTFLPYDLDMHQPVVSGSSVELRADPTHTTTVYKMQEAFNNVTLPSDEVYRSAIEGALRAGSVDYLDVADI